MVVRAETVHFYVVALIMPPQREQLRCAIVFLIAILGMVRPWRSVVLRHRATEVPGRDWEHPHYSVKSTNLLGTPPVQLGLVRPRAPGPLLRWCWAAYCLNGRGTAAFRFATLGLVGPALRFANEGRAALCQS